ncbi:MAG: hypothetical protein II871_02190 [Clostridia bacterium]|nr:hypothetical protein [Clostridia bacterium]
MNHYERKSSHNKTVFAIFPAIVILALLFSLQGCIWIPRSAYYNDIAKETVTSIDIFDVRDDAPCRPEQFLEEYDPIQNLSDEAAQEFLNELAEFRFSNDIFIVLAAMDPSFNYGSFTARINYADGTYQLISCYGCGETYTSSGECIDINHYLCDIDTWEEFIKKYLPENYGE